MWDFLNPENLLAYLKKNNKNFIIHLIDDFIKILFTILILKFIILITNLFFTEEPIPAIVYFMEIAAHIGILLIFIIYIVSDIIAIYREKLSNEGS